MFDKTIKKLATKMGRTVQETAIEAVEPIKNEVKEAAGNKVDLYSRILRLGVLLILFIEGTRRVTNSSEQSSPTQIVVNNYFDKEQKGGA